MLARVALRASRAVAAAAIVPRIAVVPSLPVRAFAAAAAAAGTPAFIVFDETQHKLDDIVTKPDAKVVAYFTASWCGPCRQIAPRFAELADKHTKDGITFLKIDVDDNGDTAAAANISAVPTFRSYSKGAVVDSFSGADTGKLTSTITALLAK